MNVLLRLGCALLACAGIAVARTPAGPVDEAAAARRAQEHRSAPVIEEARDVSLEAPSESASVRPDRRARPDFRRFSSAAVGRLRIAPSFAAVAAAVAAVPCSVAFGDVRLSSPRAPPASA